MQVLLQIPAHRRVPTEEEQDARPRRPRRRGKRMRRRPASESLTVHLRKLWFGICRCRDVHGDRDTRTHHQEGPEDGRRRGNRDGHAAALRMRHRASRATHRVGVHLRLGTVVADALVRRADVVCRGVAVKSGLVVGVADLRGGVPDLFGFERTRVAVVLADGDLGAVRILPVVAELVGHVAGV